MARKKPSWYPTQEQEILLKTSLADNRDEAISYWEQWNSRNSISGLKSESYLLLQSAISNLLSQGVPLPQKLRNVSHHTAARNLVAIRIAQQIVREFTKYKIPLYALKGLALYAGDVYPRVDARAMYDIDVYVSDKYYKTALKILLTLGWVKSADDGHSVLLIRKGFPCQIDLHRRPLWFQLTPHVISKIEKDTEIIPFKGNPLRIMKPELQMVHILIHGARCGINDYSSNTSPHLRWIIDVYYLVGNKKLNWKHFLNWVEILEAGIQVTEALEFLKLHFKIAIPSSVITTLKNMPKTRTQKLHARYSMAYTQPKFFKIPRNLRASFHAWLLQNRTPAYINTLTFNMYVGEFGQFLKVGFSLDKNQSITIFIVKKILFKPSLLLP